MSQLLRWVRASTAVALWPAYWLSGFARRDPSLWVFGSRLGRAFSDNSKWLFLACNRDPRLHAVWLTRSSELVRTLRAMGFRAYHVASPRGILTAWRAGTYLFDETAGAFNVWFSRGARFVNLWHGVPLKRIEADIPPSSRYYRYFPRWSPRWIFQRVFRLYATIPHDHLVATSEGIGKLLASAFRIDASRVLVTGYPRNDPLFQPASAEDEAVLERGRADRIIGYFPTFREVEAGPAVHWEWPALDAVMRARNALLVVKLHPNDSRRIDNPGLQNIRVLAPGVDLYTVLPRLDALVTDYSSVFFDYLLLDRPLVFFPYDLDHYERDERGFYFRYEHVTPGPKATTFQELEARLAALLDDYDREAAAWRDARHHVTRLAHRFRDGGSSRRLIDALLGSGDTSDFARRGTDGAGS